MSVLVEKQIQHLCENSELIDPYEEDRVRQASYDLSVGSEYRLSEEENERKLNQCGVIQIDPHCICYVLTKECVKMPHDVCGLICPRSRWVREGLLMYPQPPIEPGSTGKLYVLLHNLTSTTKYLRHGEHLASLVFVGSDSSVVQGYGEKEGDVYGGAMSLEALGLGHGGISPYTSILEEVSNKIKTWREELLSKWMPILLILMTIFLMLLTIMQQMNS